MKLFYRISDNSYKKTKLIGSSKEVCLKNFIKTFQNIIFGNCGESSLPYWNPPMLIIGDKCEKETCQMLKKTSIPLTFTNYGNAGSLMHAIELAIKNEDNDEVIYFCEDDYLHLPSSPKLIEEGIKRSDYVTLYDHPDKYTPQYNGGEFSKVIKTESSHWRYTISTCMTFASKVKTLKEDFDIWKKHTNGDHPHDHQIFTELGKEKNRRLAVCIPGAACHTDLEYSTRMKKMMIDPWAIDMMIDELQRKLSSRFDRWLEFKSGLEKLMALDALLKNETNLTQNHDR